MRPFQRIVLTCFLCAIVPSLAIACLWDVDTIEMERARFPTALELIAGKFLRHSQEFYEWRIADRLKKLESSPNNLALLDDLAVAYDKTNKRELAIQTGEKTLSLQPGRYESEANLGTFYLHAGDFEKGIRHIDEALKINPNAHFGREKYQKLLAEYVQSRRVGDSVVLPLSQGKTSQSFSQYLIESLGRGLRKEEVHAAVTGVLGMMRFGKHDSPILLEALGSLLSDGFYGPGWVPHEEVDGRLLAARAYLKASYAAPDESAREGYRKMAQAVTFTYREHDHADGGREFLDRIESELAGEIKDAESWYAELRNKEIEWISSGVNPEEEFNKLYITEVSLPGARSPTEPLESWYGPPWKLFANVACVGILVALLVYIRVTKRRSITSPQLAENSNSDPVITDPKRTVEVVHP